MKLRELDHRLYDWMTEVATPAAAVFDYIENVGEVDLVFTDSLPFDWIPFTNMTAITVGRTIHLRSKWMEPMAQLDDRAVALLLHELRHVFQQQGKNTFLWQLGYVFNRFFGGRTLEKDADLFMAQLLPSWRNRIGMNEDQPIPEFG